MSTTRQVSTWCPHLLIVEVPDDGDDATVRAERELVAAPVWHQGIQNLPILSKVPVQSRHSANSRARSGILGNSKRVRSTLECRPFVVDVDDLDPNASSRTLDIVASLDVDVILGLLLSVQRLDERQGSCVKRAE